MDKIVWNTRVKPTADDMNQSLSDAETGINNTVKEALFGEDTVQTGLTGTGSESNYITLAAGRAYTTSDGKRINVAGNTNLYWNGTTGQVANAATNRMDLISIKHAYLDGATQPRTFIDTDITSSTYGEAYTSNVVVDKDDYYQIYVTSGSGESSAPVNVPFFPSGTIPLFTAQIYSGTSTKIYTHQIDNDVFDRYRSENVKTLRDITKMFVYDTGWVAIGGASVTMGTTRKWLKPNISLSVRDSNLDTASSRTEDYYSGGYSATYFSVSGTVVCTNTTGVNDRYARAILMDYVGA